MDQLQISWNWGWFFFLASIQVVGGIIIFDNTVNDNIWLAITTDKAMVSEKHLSAVNIDQKTKFLLQ